MFFSKRFAIAEISCQGHPRSSVTHVVQ